MGKRLMGWMCMMALLLVPAVAMAGLNVEFDDEFLRGGAKVDYGTGTGASYVPGSEYEVLNGYAYQYSTYITSGHINLGHTGGAGPTGDPDVLASLHTYGNTAGTYRAWFDDFRPSLVWNWQDMDNYHFVQLNRMYRAALGGYHGVVFGYYEGGTANYVAGWDTIGSVEEGGDDIGDIKIDWDPVNNTVDIYVYWTDKTGTVVKFDSTVVPVSAVDPSKWESGRFGGSLHGLIDGLSYANIVAEEPAPIPEPVALALFGLGGIGLLRRRRG